MLSKRSAASTHKKAMMADYTSLMSPTEKYGRQPSSSALISPRLFTTYIPKGITDSETMSSPTSILDTKPFSVKTPFWSENNNNIQSVKSPKPDAKSHFDKLDSRGVGLGLADALTDEKTDTKESKPDSKTRMVLFGSQLKIQIPPLPSAVLSVDFPPSPGDFGIKTRNSVLGLFSPGPIGSTGQQEKSVSPRAFSGSLSATEMELSEDYTCVISHGPNPKTTHIFEDCIVESCCGVGFAGSRRENRNETGSPLIKYPSESFLSFCHNCKKDLGLEDDLYMYRGEKAFCTSECRDEGIRAEEEKAKLESKNDVYGDCY